MYTKSASQRLPAVHTSPETPLQPLHIPGMYTKTPSYATPAVHTSLETPPCPLHIPGMYTKSPSYGLPAVHTSPETPSWPLYMPGMYTKTASQRLPAVHTSPATGTVFAKCLTHNTLQLFLPAKKPGENTQHIVFQLLSKNAGRDSHLQWRHLTTTSPHHSTTASPHRGVTSTGLISTTGGSSQKMER